MFFITCFDKAWMQNARWMAGIEPAPRDEQNRVQYRKDASSFTAGYFVDQARALQAVEDNETDLQAHRYGWCVVEEVGEGMHPISVNRAWFRWEGPASTQVPCGKWVRCEPPRETQRCSCFALG